MSLQAVILLMALVDLCYVKLVFQTMESLVLQGDANFPHFWQ